MKPIICPVCNHLMANQLDVKDTPLGCTNSSCSNWFDNSLYMIIRQDIHQK